MTTVRAVVTDIEGTTTPLAFVHEVLFSLRARAPCPFCVRRMKPTVRLPPRSPMRARLRRYRGTRTYGRRTVRLLLSWLDEDRKAGPLKLLQGLIWRKGYEEGVLKGEVYEDAAAMLRRWHDRGLRLFVYSSGSEEAQRLIFGCSDKGDLAPLFEGFFDTRIGAKIESGSYRAIAERAGLDAGAMLFLSDHAGEIAAAKEAGMRVVQIDRALAPDAWSEGEVAPVAGSFGPVDRRFFAE